MKVWEVRLGGLHKVLNQPKAVCGSEMVSQRPSQMEIREWGIFRFRLIIGMCCPWKAGTTCYVIPFFRRASVVRLQQQDHQQ